MKNILDKEIAIYKQKLEFKEVQYQQLKTQLDETKQTHEQLIKTLESKSREHSDTRELTQKQL